MKRFNIILLVVLINSLLAPTLSANSRQLPNGYAVDPLATVMVGNLAKIFKGYYELKRNGSGCSLVEVKYAEVDGHDKVYQWVVKQADKAGNWDGIASLAELQKMYDAACQNRGK